MLKFYYNGIRENGKLYRAYYSGGPWVNGCPEGMIKIRAKDYVGFITAKEIRATFPIENNSDGMTDYFEKDCIRVLPSHPLYPQVKVAMEQCQARYKRAA